MSFGISGDDIVKLGKKAWVLWEMGFSQAKNAEKQYAKFGAEIQYFVINLQQLGQVIFKVTKQVPPWLRDDYTLDLKSFLHICGDFRKTLNKCERLLEDSANFERGRGNFIYNIRWNLSVQLQVTVLKDRVAFHNIKIANILKPLELKLLLDLKKEIYDVHSDLASQITEVHEIVGILENYRGRFVDGISNELVAPPVSPRVPEYLEIRFEAAIVATNPELRDQAKFPLAQGINAFHHHFEQSTSKFHPENNISLASDSFTERIPVPVQYLNLMKSIWIVQMIKQGDEYAHSMSDKLWKFYIWELDEKFLLEFSRFIKIERPTKHLKEPDRRILDLFREEEFGIWLEDEEEEEEEEEESHYQPGLDYLNEILR
ncbi:hypothetical protein MMC31_007736, partial [Peltigera leucophlebia]|nr:hypothetical protein [Peltigera leucophlebia]